MQFAQGGQKPNDYRSIGSYIYDSSSETKINIGLRACQSYVILRLLKYGAGFGIFEAEITVMARMLVIDDEPGVLNVINGILDMNGYEVVAISDGELGMKEIERHDYDLVITDLMMPDVDGMEVLEFVETKSPKPLCVIITGYGTIKNAVEAIKMGAFDFLTKPIKPNELVAVVERALEFKRLREENIRLKRELRRNIQHDHIVGTSDPIRKIYGLIEKVADTDCTVLITGPSGTGKELIARAIHYNSSRCDNSLVVVNCGAIPAELLESELFGHEKGAFTGAHKTRIGRFEMANGGTFFLDEIGEMSPALQVKLLRVLQDQKFERVGGTRTIHVDVRIIAATNKNLTMAINKGAFREDLYYRLNVILIKVPPLKQRKSDILLLVDFFYKKLQKGKKKRIQKLSPEAMDALLAYDWPGNVRELENVIRRLTILCDNQVADIDDLPEHIQQKCLSAESILDDGSNLDKAVRNYEKRLILDALEKSDWVKAKAAKILNIKRTTLVEKIKKQHLTRELPDRHVKYPASN